MRNTPLLQLALLSVLMSMAGGWLYVQFRAWRGDDEPYSLFLIAIGIGAAIAYVADHRRHARMVIVIAVVSAVSACVIGNLRVAMLEREAILLEFDRHALESEEYFVALEAYLTKYRNDSSAPPFTDVTRRAHYPEAEWLEAENRWRSKPRHEQVAIRQEKRSSYENLARMADQGVADVFLAPWNWVVYAIAAGVAAGIVSVIQWDDRQHRAS